ARRHAALGHDAARQHEERDGEQHEVVGAVRDAQHHGLERNIGPQRADQRGEPERIGDRHAERAQHREAAEQDQDVHYSSSAGASLYMTSSFGGSPSQIFSMMKSRVSAPPIGIGM